MYKEIVAMTDGLYYGGELVSNCLVKIRKLYSLPNSDDPSFADVEVSVVGREPRILLCPLGEISFDYVKTRVPLARCSSPKAFEGYLVKVFNDALSDQSMPIGTYYNTSGIQATASGRTCVVVGSHIIGNDSSNDVIAPEVSKLTPCCRVEMPLTTLFALISKLPSVVIFAVIYGFATLMGSVLRQETDFQGVLFLFGPSAVGKTTLARIICGWVLDASKGMAPALLYDAGTTLSAFQDAMAQFRDLPLLYDDGCIPGRMSTRGPRLKKTEAIVRNAANLSKIEKKAPGGKTLALECSASVIITGEYPLDEISLLNRSILAHVKEFLNLPPEFTSDLVGGAALAFLGHFVGDVGRNITWLRQFIETEPDEVFDISPDERVTKNLRVMQWVNCLAIEAARAEGAELADIINAERKFNQAVADSLKESSARIQNKQKSIRKKTIPKLIYEGFKNQVFSLAEKAGKLWENDGIIFQGDICLRGEALLAYIMRQDGYQDVTLREISDALFRIGSLVIQEEGTRTVKIRQDLPRVYRIRLHELKRAAKTERL